MNASPRPVMPDFLRGRPTPRVAVAIAALGAIGVDPERVEEVPVSPLQSFLGEIVGQVPAPGAEIGPEDRIVFFVSRDGLTERLPHDFLEPLPTTKDEARVALEPGQTLDFWERQVKAYGPGRQFVTVIDRALGRSDREIGRVQIGLAPIGADASFARATLDFAQVPDLGLDDDEAIFLAAELQRLHGWLGHADGVATFLGQFLDLPVRVESQPGTAQRLPEEACPPLGTARARLGGALALGPQFRDPTGCNAVKVGPLPLAQFHALDRDAVWWRKLRGLVDLCTEASRDSRVELELRTEDRGARLGDPMRSRLGRTTHLGAP